MGLAVGMQLGPYKVTAFVGQGGMGEVYRARDARLDRDVALKVLPDLFVNDPSRLLRFQREAKALASLNHRNIAQIHGLEEAGQTRALVLEYVEGRTLADCIAAGPIPVHDALHIAQQIAEALEAAHEAGIIHRDLKPANVKVTSDGVVKVLDFGLAKALERETAGDSSESPTLTAATRDGAILGTAAYMSPEQARGRPADRRADIWAFGAVLFEMLTGRRAFDRETVPDTVAAVIEVAPDFSRIPRDVPIAVQRLLRRCLTKNPRDRLQDIGDARIEIADARSELSRTSDTSTEAPAVASVTRAAIRALPWVAGIAIGGALTGSWLGWRLSPPVLAPQVVEFPIVLSPNERITGPGGSVIAISPDGRRVAYLANRQIWVRELNSLAARPIPGTEIGGSAFTRDIFFSHDGQWIGFTAGRELRKVSLDGVQRSLAPMEYRPVGAHWNDDDMIYFGRHGDGVWRVRGAGGKPEQVIALTNGEQARRPQLLPGGEWMLYSLLSANARSWNEARIVVQSLTTGAREVLIEGREAVYVSTGHLVYMLGSAVLAVPFDVTSRKPRGTPVRLAESLYSIRGETGHFSVSSTGTLAYLPSASIPSTTRMLWVGRDGREYEIPAPAREYSTLRVSPNGNKVAVHVQDPGTGSLDVWIWDIASNTLNRLTLGGAVNAVWAGNSRLVVAAAREGQIEVRMIRIDGGVDARRLFVAPVDTRPSAMTADGGLIFVQRRLGPEGQMDIHLFRLATGEAQPLLATDFHEVRPALSPDGRWLAYQSDEAGRPEIFVVPFPDVGQRRWQVSVGGGEEPKWSPRGDELYYVDVNAGQMMAVAIDTRQGFSHRALQGLFSIGDYELSLANNPNYEIAPDGRFLFQRAAGPADASNPQQFVVVLNVTARARDGTN